MAAAESAGAPSGSLAELLRKTIAQLRQQSPEAGGDAVLYLGTRHQAFPTLLVTDPILEPVDKIIWMVLCRHSSTREQQAAFPGYERIGRDANVSSRTTIARALAILRASRWLSLCARVRGLQGRFAGNVYALHEEPLPLRDALRLDRDYLPFLDAAKAHAHPRVRIIAAAVLASIDDDIRRGVEITAPLLEPERRLDAEQAANSSRSRPYFSFTANVLSRLSNQPGDDAAHGDQSVAAENHVQNLDMGVCSSRNNKNTTTPSALISSEEIARDQTRALTFPVSLTPNQHALAARYIAAIPAATRQPVLDELEGRIRAARRGAKPLYDPVRYLHRLCREANAGRFAPNLGDGVLHERARSERPAISSAGAPAEIPSPPQPKPEWKPGDNPVQAIRDRFSLPTRLRRP